MKILKIILLLILTNLINRCIYIVEAICFVILLVCAIFIVCIAWLEWFVYSLLGVQEFELSVTRYLILAIYRPFKSIENQLNLYGENYIK